MKPTIPTLLIVCMWALPAHAVGPFDGDTEVQAPIDFLSTERSMHAIRDFVR